MSDYGLRRIAFQCLLGTFYEYDIIQANASPNTGGTWTITVAGQTTSAINHNANAATILAALEALSNVAPGDVTVTFTSGTSLASASARLVLNWSGGAFQNSDPVVTVSFASMTGGTNPTFTETIHQVISIPSGRGSNKTIKGARVVISGASSLDTATGAARLSIGLTDGTRQRACAVMAENTILAGSANAGVRSSNVSVIEITGTASNGQEAQAEHFSFGTNDGKWTIQWNVKPSDNYRGVAQLYFGADLQLYVNDVTGDATIGNSVSLNPGFSGSPTLFVETFSVNKSFGASAGQADAMLSWGLCDENLAQAVQAVCAEDQQGNTSVGNYMNYSAATIPRVAVALVSTAGTVSKLAGLEITTLSTSAVDFTTRDDNSSLSAMVMVLGFPSKVRVYISAETFVAGTSGTGNPITGLGFVPLAYSIGSVRAGALNTVGNGQGQISIGGWEAEGNVQSVNAWADRDNRTTSEASSFASASLVIYVHDFASPIDWRAAHSARGNGTITLDVTDTSAANGDRVVMFWAVEDFFSGSGAGTFPLATGSGTGALSFRGSGAGTFPLATGAATGRMFFSATGAGTFPLATGTGTGALKFLATGAGTFPLTTGAATGRLIFSATGAGSFPLATGTGTGTTADGFTGTGDGTFPLATGTGTGALVFRGSGAGTFPLATGAATGRLIFSATGSGSFPLATAAGTGLLAFTGAGAAVLPLAQGSGAGLLLFSASGAGTFPLAQGAGSGRLIFQGSGAGTLPLATGSGTGFTELVYSGSGAGTFPLATAAGQALLQFIGSGAGTLPLPTASGVALELFSATGAGTLPLATGVGLGSLVFSATGAGTLPLPTGTGTGNTQFTYTGSGAGTFPLATGTGTGVLRFVGTGAGTLPLPTGTGTGIGGELLFCSTKLEGQYLFRTKLEGSYRLSTSLQGRYDNTSDLEGQVTC